MATPENAAATTRGYYDRGSHLALLLARDDERKRIARDLHDVTAQLLLELQFAVDSLEPAGAAGRNLAQETAHGVIARLQKQVRCLTYVLHPPELEKYGLDGALEALALGMSARSGLEIAYRSRGYRRGMPAEVELTMLRIAQEALMNVFKHSGSRRAELRLHCTSDWLCLRVRDFGLGKRAEVSLRSRQGVGLRSMHSRMESLGGNIVVRPLEGGTSVTAIVRRPFAS